MARLVGRQPGDTSSAHQYKTVLGKGFLMNEAMWRYNKRWPLILLHQWAAENPVTSKMMLQTITMRVTFCVQLQRLDFK